MPKRKLDAMRPQQAMFDEEIQEDEWLATCENTIGLAALTVKLHQWVLFYNRLLDADHETRMHETTIPIGTPCPPNPWMPRLKAMVVLGQALDRELSWYGGSHFGTVDGSAAFLTAYDEAIAECKAVDSLAARPPLDFAKLMANIKPPPKEWFDREHELDAEGREWCETGLLSTPHVSTRRGKT